MQRKINYYVIGGQYAPKNHGGTPTLEGAKRLATKNVEYWDNWQGWHKPAIYRAEDCEVKPGWFGTDYYPKETAIAFMTWDNFLKKWV